MSNHEAKAVLRSVTDEELRASGRNAARIRAIAAVVLSVLAAVAAELTALESWRVYVLPLVVYAALSLGVLALLSKRPSTRLTAWLAVVDLVLVALVQWRTLPFSAHPAGVAAFTAALISLVIVLDGAALPTRAILPLSGLGAVLLWPILVQGGSDVASRLVAVVVLLLVGSAVLVQRIRREKLALKFAAAEVERAREQAEVERTLREKEASERALALELERNEMLRRLQADKDTLTQFLVHDLRSPLSVVISYLELVGSFASKPGREAKIVPAVEEALGVAGRLTGLISDILDVQKLEDGRLQPRLDALDVATLVGAIGRSQQRSATNVTIEVDALPGAKVNGDAALLSRVVENLLSNARRYTPEGGRVRVSVKLEDGDVVARVQNEGNPIPDELRPRLFAKYQQAAGARHGYGLGLYFCRLAVESQGGRIALVDDPAWPVTFEFRLPRSPGVDGALALVA